VSGILQFCELNACSDVNEYDPHPDEYNQTPGECIPSQDNLVSKFQVSIAQEERNNRYPN
jgi:hypothetical protein